MSHILPTVGRVLYFQPSENDRVIQLEPEQPLRADIIFVHSPASVKLHVIDHSGNHFTMADVPLVQSGQEAPDCGYAYWMPYQVGQAKAAEAPAPASTAAPAAAAKKTTAKRR